MGELEVSCSPTCGQSDLEGSLKSDDESAPNTSDLESSDESSVSEHGDGDAPDTGAPAVPRAEDGAIVPVTPAQKGAAIAAAAAESAFVPARANSPFPL